VVFQELLLLSGTAQPGSLRENRFYNKNFFSIFSACYEISCRTMDLLPFKREGSKMIKQA